MVVVVVDSFVMVERKGEERGRKCEERERKGKTKVGKRERERMMKV